MSQTSKQVPIFKIVLILRKITGSFPELREKAFCSLNSGKGLSEESFKALCYSLERIWEPRFQTALFLKVPMT